MAYEIIKKLKQSGNNKILYHLHKSVTQKAKNRGKKHQVFNPSFDASPIESTKEIEKVLDYMHHNPVSKKWNLCDDYATYQYSSAAFYENGENSKFLKDFREYYS